MDKDSINQVIRGRPAPSARIIKSLGPGFGQQLRRARQGEPRLDDPRWRTSR